jgi:hypothetical protein
MPYPAKKTPELCAQVIERLSLGETLSSISRDLKFNPMTWNKWCREDKELGIAHDEARSAGADAIADDALAIVDEMPSVVEGKIDPGHVSWAKNRAEYRLKLLAKWQPKKYGDKTTTELTGAGGKDLPGTPESVDLALRLGASLRAAKRDGE